MSKAAEHENWLAEERKKIKPRQINLLAEIDEAMQFNNALQLAKALRKEFMGNCNEQTNI